LSPALGSADRRMRFQGAILDGWRLLLIKNHEQGSGKIYWLLPGGGREPGETPQACVKREVREETGLDVEVSGLLLDIPSSLDDLYQRLLTFECHVLAGVAAPGVEPEVDSDLHRTIIDVRWFDLQDESELASLSGDPFTFPQLLAIRDMLKERDG